jgi:hypothetical protein
MQAQLLAGRRSPETKGLGELPRLEEQSSRSKKSLAMFMALREKGSSSAD